MPINTLWLLLILVFYFAIACGGGGGGGNENVPTVQVEGYDVVLTNVGGSQTITPTNGETVYIESTGSDITISAGSNISEITVSSSGGKILIDPSAQIGNIINNSTGTTIYASPSIPISGSSVGSSVGYPDLQIVNLALYDTIGGNIITNAEAGDNLIVFYSIQNNQNVPTYDDFTVLISDSSGNTFTQTVTSTISASSTFTPNNFVSLSLDTGDIGVNTIEVEVDFSDTNWETDESNNLSVTNVTVSN